MVWRNKTKNLILKFSENDHSLWDKIQKIDLASIYSYFNLFS